MSVLLAASSSSLLAKSLVIALAAAGGAIVFLGLLLEKIAEWKSEKYIVKPCQRLSETGWWFLMIGIAVEIGVAIWSANDAWQTSQNTPPKMRVGSISATAEFMVETNWDEPGTIFGDMLGVPAILTFSDQPLTNRLNSSPSTNRLGFVGVILVCDDVKWRLDWWNPSTKRNGSTITLQFNRLLAGYENLTQPAFNRPAEDLIKDLKFFKLTPGFLVGNRVRVYNGRLVLLVNGVPKIFERMASCRTIQPPAHTPGGPLRPLEESCC